MAIKYREAEELRRTTRENLTRTPENWMRFLRTASNTYKYSYQDQLMISAQFPDATAVASFDVWSDRFGRRIRSGEKGIGLIDDSGTRPKMKYVFDISQSDRYRDVPQPYVWDLQEEFKDDIILSLAGDLSISIEEAVSDFCENTVDSLLVDYENAVIANAGNSSLAGQDKNTVKESFREAVIESVKFVVLTRCGLDADVVNKDVFGSLSSFSDGRMQVFSSSDGKQEQVGLEVPPDSISITIGESESSIIHEVIRRVESMDEPLSYGAVNLIFEYLDKKQHHLVMRHLKYHKPEKKQPP